jgi:hypothetical protein
MESKIVYSFDDKTGEYISEYKCQPDPKNAGQFLIPRNATEIKPIEVSLNEVACFNGKKWQKKEDLRGRKQICKKTLKITEIKEIGSVIKDQFLLNKEQVEAISQGRIPTFEDNALILNEPQKIPQELRQSEYPDIAEFLDAHVKINSDDPELRKEGKEQLSKYYHDCQAVKMKYPKTDKDE